jgi:hypothetical protein
MYLDCTPKGSLFLRYKAIQSPATKNKKSLKRDKIFKCALKKFLILHSFYTVEEYFEYSYN